MQPGLTQIGINKISYKRGHRYLTVVVDHDTGRPMWAHPGRDRATVRAFFDALEHWVNYGLPRDGQPISDLFLTDRGGAFGGKDLWKRMRNLVYELGFPPSLDLHSLRRAYATHLQTEYGYDLSFVQMPLGHEHAATTSIYTIASPDYRARHFGAGVVGHAASQRLDDRLEALADRFEIRAALDPSAAGTTFDA